MEINSINGQENISVNLKYYFLSNLCECTPFNVSRMAETLVAEKVGDIIIIETKPIFFYSNWESIDSINPDYRMMQFCVANGAKVCSILGIDFSIKEKKDYGRKCWFQRSQTENFSTVYTITLSGIDTNQLIFRAEAYRISYENQIVRQIRNSCSGFYQHIYTSPVVESVAVAFTKKIKEIAENRFVNKFKISVTNQSISLGEEKENYAVFSFAENSLTNLSEKHQRLGFCLAVMDRITAQIKDTPILGSKTEATSQIIITNRAHVVSRPNIDEKNNTEEFELIFSKYEQKKSESDWY